MIKNRLFTPGPTDVPPEVLNEMAKPIFHHRTGQFREMFAEVNTGLKKLLCTSNDVLTHEARRDCLSLDRRRFLIPLGAHCVLQGLAEV